MKQKGGYRQIFKQHLFLQNTIANVINRLGDSIDMIAFSWLVYEITGSPSWSAVMLGVNMLPTVFIQPFAGALVEQLNKKYLIGICDISRGVLTCMLAVLFILGFLNPWILLVITFLNNTFEAFRGPANTAILPQLLSKEYYEFGMSFSQTSSRICELIGIGLSGIIIANLGVFGAIIIDAISFFLCAGLIVTIPLKEKAIEVRQQLSRSSYIQSLKEGFSYIKQVPILCLLCIIALLMNAILVPFNSFLTPYISGTLHQSAQLLSFSNILLTIGLIFGAFLYPYLHKYLTHRTLFLGSVGISSTMYFCTFFIQDSTDVILIYSVLGIFCFLFGFAIAQLNSIASVSFMNHVDPEYLARFSAIFGAIATAAMPMTSFILSVICTSISVVQMFLIAGVFTILLFIGMMFVTLLKEL